MKNNTCTALKGCGVKTDVLTAAADMLFIATEALWLFHLLPDGCSMSSLQVTKQMNNKFLFF